MTLQLCLNPTEAAINAKAATPVPPLRALDVDLLPATEIAAALLLGLIIGPSRYASRIGLGAANGRVLYRAVEEGERGKTISVVIVNQGGSLARIINVTGRVVTISPTTVGGAISDTATVLVAALNADAGFKNLLVASVAETDTGAGLVLADAGGALGPVPPLLGNAERKRAGELLAHADLR